MTNLAYHMRWRVFPGGMILSVTNTSYASGLILMKHYLCSLCLITQKSEHPVRKEGFSVLNNIIIQLFSGWEVLDKYIIKSLCSISSIEWTFISPFFFLF